MYNSINRSFIVCRQGFHSGERFNTLDEATYYASTVAKSRPNEVLEILTCTHNVKASVPVDIITEAS